MLDLGLAGPLRADEDIVSHRRGCDTITELWCCYELDITNNDSPVFPAAHPQQVASLQQQQQQLVSTDVQQYIARQEMRGLSHGQTASWMRS